MRTTRREFLVASGTAASVGVVGTASAQEAPTVRMISEGDTYYYDPIGLSVDPGTTVTFENAAGSHNAVSYDDRIPTGASAFETPLGETADVTFEEPGTYDYYCVPHKTLGMVGRVVVDEPGGPAEGSMPPDGDVPDSEVVVEREQVGHDAFVSGEVGGGGDSGGDSGGGFDQVLVGTGLFGAVSILAVLAYWFVNSEGESERVGSSDWKRRHGVQ